MTNGSIYQHQDGLACVSGVQPLRERLRELHRVIQVRLPFVARVAVALVDEGTHTLKTYVHSSGDDNPLSNYEASLEEAPSLRETIHMRSPRVVNDLSLFQDGEHVHTRRIWEQGYRASYALPVFQESRLAAFVFFNSREKECFTPAVLEDLDLFGHLIGQMVNEEQGKYKILLAALRTAIQMIHQRDPELGGHLERMAHFSRIIARHLNGLGRYDFNDQLVEHIFQFAPLHDVGKIGIPDRVLMKTGRLDQTEKALMRTHTSLGRQLVDNIAKSFGIESMEQISLLRSVTELHHEAMDGSGYPKSLRGEEIPIEARIIAVADVFDALTSERPYKQAWSNDDAFAYLIKEGETTLDRDCIEAMILNREAVERIQTLFRD
ncbi:MAG: HD domain-containing protein [Holophagaceae bacterium]|nr:HD domain-containing protein [Holophagaceae bacterium]